MNIHKIKQESTSMTTSVQRLAISGRAGQLPEPMKERIFGRIGRRALGFGVGVGLGLGMLMSPNAAVAQNNADSTQGIADNSMAGERVEKKTALFGSSYGPAYEYLVCYSGRKIRLPPELFGADDPNHGQTAWSIVLLGAFELKMADGGRERARQLIIFNDRLGWEGGRENQQWQTVPLEKVDIIGMPKTEYELKINEGGADLRLNIRCSGALDTDEVYGTIVFRRDADSLGIGEFSPGLRLEKLKLPGNPLSEFMRDGYPQYKPERKEMYIALPKENHITR